jgi:hypothetical protein
MTEWNVSIPFVSGRDRSRGWQPGVVLYFKFQSPSCRGGTAPPVQK